MVSRHVYTHMPLKLSSRGRPVHNRPLKTHGKGFGAAFATTALGFGRPCALLAGATLELLLLGIADSLGGTGKSVLELLAPLGG